MGNSTSSYKAVIQCNFNQFGENELLKGTNQDPMKYLLLDLVKNKSNSSDITLAQQPLQNGDVITDHMYRNAKTFTLTGEFSLNGKNWNDDSYNFGGQANRLSNIQKVFETIQANGLLCDILTLQVDDNNGIDTNNVEFLKRSNMALKNISWSEHQNNMNFSFTFTEIIMVKRQEYEELTDEAKKDLNLPDISEPIGKSLGSILVDTNQLKEIVIESLYRSGYLDQEWINEIVISGSAMVVAGTGTAITVGAAVGGAVGVALGVLIYLIINMAKEGIFAVSAEAVGAIVGVTAAAIGIAKGVSVLTKLSVSVPGGLIVAAAVAVVAFIGLVIYATIQRKKKEERIKKAFKLVNGDYTPDLKRLNNLLNDIEIQINKVNSNITVYSINSDDPQKILINIAGNVYQLIFTRNNVNNYSWETKVLTLDDKTVQLQNNFAITTSFTELNRNENMWFTDSTKEYEVYLVNPSLNSEYNNTQEEINNIKKKLSTYQIWVSYGRVENNINNIVNAINTAIESEGFVA